MARAGSVRYAHKGNAGILRSPGIVDCIADVPHGFAGMTGFNMVESIGSGLLILNVVRGDNRVEYNVRRESLQCRRQLIANASCENGESATRLKARKKFFGRKPFFPLNEAIT